jgi:acyl carrier protein
MAGDAKRAIRAFVSGQLGGDGLTDDQDLFASGLATSLFAMELIGFLEGEFAITIDNDDLELENFSSVDRLAALVERKLATAA